MLVGYGVRWCDEHLAAYRAEDRERRGNPRDVYGAAWQRARLVYLAANPLCVECLAVDRVTPARDVDHVVPHRGDLARFWDRSNWQSLCATCHKIKTAREDGGFGTTAGRFPNVRPSRVPFVLVAGPPGAGKSSWVRARLGAGVLVLDLDLILAELTHRPIYARASDDEWRRALRVRNARLAELAEFPPRYAGAFLIASAPTLAERSWWRERGARVVVLATPLVECERRIRADPRRDPQCAARHVEVARKWWARYTADPLDEVISLGGERVEAPRSGSRAGEPNVTAGAP